MTPWMRVLTRILSIFLLLSSTTTTIVTIITIKDASVVTATGPITVKTTTRTSSIVSLSSPVLQRLQHQHRRPWYSTTFTTATRDASSSTSLQRRTPFTSTSITSIMNSHLHHPNRNWMRNIMSKTQQQQLQRPHNCQHLQQRTSLPWIGRSRHKQPVLAAIPVSAIVTASTLPTTAVKTNVDTPILSLGYTIIASAVEIATSTAVNYCTGYVTGYVFGTIITIVPTTYQKIFQRTTTATSSQQLVDNIQQQNWIRQIHVKSHEQYGKKWGTISSIFTGCRTTTRILRRRQLMIPPELLQLPSSLSPSKKQQQQQMLLQYQMEKEQEHEKWNDIISSFLAGALLARNDGPVSMLRNGLLFAGMSYVFAPPSSSTTSNTKFTSSFIDKPLIEF